MLLLLSPAKTLTEGPALHAFPVTAPVLRDDVRILQNTVRTLTAPKLRKLMDISDELATQNYTRHQALTVDPTSAQARQAAFLFAGDVYRGLDAATLSPEAVAWAQDHVGILSGLYGILRPLDATQPYRLEMGTALKTRRGTTLYDFWSDHITKAVNTWVRDGGHDAVINLASQEYFKSVQPKKLAAPVITPVFEDIKDGKARVLGFFAKQARGAMVRWAATQGANAADDLKACDAMSYTFNPERSTSTHWVFQRPQPPPPK